MRTQKDRNACRANRIPRRRGTLRVHTNAPSLPGALGFARRSQTRAGMAPACLQAPPPLSLGSSWGVRQKEAHLPPGPCFPRRGQGSKSRMHKWALQTASHPPAWPSSIYNSPPRLGVPALQRRGLVTAFRPKVSLKRGERGAHRNRTPSVPRPPPPALQPHAGLLRALGKPASHPRTPMLGRWGFVARSVCALKRAPVG